MNTRNSHSSPSAVAVFVCFWDKPDDKSGFAAQFQLWLPCRRAGSAKPGLRGYCTDSPTLHRLFSQCLCRVRQVADPYKVNSRKLPQNPQADNIRPHTVQYTLAAVFCGRTKFATTVYFLKRLAKFQSVVSTDRLLYRCVVRSFSISEKYDNIKT